MTAKMKRREFITLVGGAAAAWPSLVQAQPTDRRRRVGVLQAQPESDTDFGSWRMLFAARLRELGWTDGENLRIDYRYGAGEAASIAPVAKELINLRPDALFAITALSAVVLILASGRALSRCRPPHVSHWGRQRRVASEQNSRLNGELKRRSGCPLPSSDRAAMFL